MLDAAIRQVDRPCRTAIDGRRAVRALADWSKRFGLSEAEFQVLWRLRSAPADGLDQTSLSQTLAFSAAQISATVERLRARGWICEGSTLGDRRRHHWLLAGSGRELLEQLLGSVDELQYEPAAKTLKGGQAHFAPKTPHDHRGDGARPVPGRNREAAA
jgi:DNA-binding MarR family transcriptional regulator